MKLKRTKENRVLAYIRLIGSFPIATRTHMVELQYFQARKGKHYFRLFRNAIGMSKYFIFSFSLGFLLLIGCNHKDVPTSTSSLWQKLDVPYFGTPVDIQFANKDTGYILAAADSNTTRNILIRTYNGGQTWDVIRFSETFYKDTAKSNLTHITPSPFNANVLIANSGNILRSVDGGRHWAILDVPTDLLLPRTSVRFAFVTPSYIVSAGAKTYQSMDSGKSWQATYEPEGYFATFNILQFTSGSTGYTAGGTVFDATNYGMMAKTTDGGNTWQPVNFPLNQAITGMYFFNDNIGYITINLYKGSITTSYASGTAIYKTEDGGNTWNTINANLQLAPYDGIGKIYFKNELEGIGNGNNIYHTVDGGKTWKMENTDKNGPLYIISYPDNTHFYVVDYYSNVYKRTF